MPSPLTLSLLPKKNYDDYMEPRKSAGPDERMDYYSKCFKILKEELGEELIDELKYLLAGFYRLRGGEFLFFAEMYDDAYLALEDAVFRYGGKIQYNRGEVEVDLNEDAIEAVKLRVAVSLRGEFWNTVIYDCDALIALHIDDLKYLQNRGVAHHECSNFDKAIADFTQAIALDPSLTETYCRRAYSYYCKDDYVRAVEDATEAIKRDVPVAPYYRAMAYHKLGEYDKAVADYDTMLGRPNLTDFDRETILSARKESVEAQGK